MNDTKTVTHKGWCPERIYIERAAKCPCNCIPCPHCDGGKNPGLGYDGRGSCYCGNTGKLDVSGPGACCTCGLVDCRCEV